MEMFFDPKLDANKTPIHGYFIATPIARVYKPKEERVTSSDAKDFERVSKADAKRGRKAQSRLASR